MQTSYIFYPKYGYEIVMKVLTCFINEFLCWHDNGFEWGLSKCQDHEGWMVLEAYPEDGNTEYFTETCFTEDSLTARQLTDSMMILLTENGTAYKSDDDIDGYALYETEITEVLAALSKTGTRIYSPYSDKVWSFKAGMPLAEQDSKRQSILDLVFPKQAA
jgi:hypothetical protein